MSTKALRLVGKPVFGLERNGGGFLAGPSFPKVSRPSPGFDKNSSILVIVVILRVTWDQVDGPRAGGYAQGPAVGDRDPFRID